ncbi:MAG: glycosyltransferase family 25 protein [Parachlamydiaceae bacterium]|nr:glycosyltransferase family 25 protein [Parachlamydiaceae bacterium]
MANFFVTGIYMIFTLNLFSNIKVKLLKNQFCLLMMVLLFSNELSARIYPTPTPVSKYLKKINSKVINSRVNRVDCIYVVNLDRRPEKWKRMQRLFKEAGINGNRFSAIDGLKISDEIQTELAGNYPVRMLRGEVGCLLSHVSVMKDAYDRGFDLIWVFEDDVEFIEDPHVMTPIIKALSSIDPNWDVLYTDMDSKHSSGEIALALGLDFRPDRLFYYPLEHYLRRKFVSADLMRLGQRYGLYSYLVSRKGMKKIYHYFTHVNLWTAVDIDIHYIPTIREYSTTREVVTLWTHSPISDTRN